MSPAEWRTAIEVRGVMMGAKRWMWMVVWALALACTVSLVRLGRVAADDEGVLVVESDGSTQVVEGGTTDGYSIVLSEAPEERVLVALMPDDQVNVEPDEVTFTSRNWDDAVMVVVSAVDDEVAEGSHVGTIAHAVSSQDDDYDGIAVPDVKVDITDDDQAGATVEPVILSMTEGGAPGSYGLRLESPPQSAVAIDVETAGDGISAIPTRLTFDGATWSAPQTVTVTVDDDEVALGERSGTVRHSPRSTDPAYDGLSISDVTVLVSEDDVAGVAVMPTTIEVAEGGEAGSYDVVLESEPTADVTIRVNTDGQTRADPAALTFTPATWDQTRTVTVTAEDDGVQEGDQEATIQHRVESSDQMYDRLAVTPVVVTVIDARPPAARVIVTESAGSTRVTEGGQGDSYTVELASRPAADVTVEIGTDGQTTATPAQCTFTAADWRQARTISVAAVDDRRAEGEHASTIHHGCASADAAYDGIDIPDVDVVVTDDDVAGVSIAPQELEMVEGDAGAGYAVALDSEPAGETTLRATTDGQTYADPRELRFTPDDWQGSRWISISAVDDAILQGTRVSEVRHSVVSGDGGYDGMVVTSVTVTVRDNERADVIVSSTAEEITERDGRADLILRLSSRPTADVVVPLSTSSAHCRLSLGAVRLTRDSWQAGVQVVVWANVDASWYGEETCTIATGPAVSGDSSYDGRDPEDVIVTLRIARNPAMLCVPMALRAWPPLPNVPALLPIDNPDGWGDYTVAWGSAERAEAYVLQESADAGFVTATGAYDGSELAHTVTGRGPGRYYYRVAGTNAWGAGPWSEAEAVDVRWEAEPNDDALTQANGPLMPDVIYHGALGGGADAQDYYLLEMVSDGRIEVWLDGIPPEQNDDLVVRDASLGLVGYSAELGSAGEHILTGVLSAGRYYLQVYQRSGGGSPGVYALRYVLR